MSMLKFIEPVFNWIEFAMHPIQSLNKLLNDKDDGFSGVYKIWGAALIISVVPSIPVLKYYGISTSNLDYYIPAIAATLVFQFCSVFSVYAALMVVGIREKLKVIVAFYTIILVYNPITVCILMPDTIRFLKVMKDVKAKELDLVTGMKNSFGMVGALSDKDVLFNVYDITRHIAAVIAAISIAAFCELVAQRGMYRKSTVYIATCIAFGATYCLTGFVQYVVSYFLFFQNIG